MGNYFNVKSLKEPIPHTKIEPICIPNKNKTKTKTECNSLKNHKMDYKINENFELVFKNSFNKSIGNDLVEKFKLYDKIVFGFSFNQSVTHKIPHNVLFIKFGHNFNKSIDLMCMDGMDGIDGIDGIDGMGGIDGLDGMYNINGINFATEPVLEEIIFGEKFNQCVDNLPISLKRITFGNDFNFPVDNLPNKLIYIKFGHNFNHIIDELPSSLEHIIFGHEFNQSIDNLPCLITCIQLGVKFEHEISILPYGLKKIILMDNYYEINKFNIDNVVKMIKCAEVCLI